MINLPSFKKDFEATGQFDVNATTSQTTAKLSLAGLKAGVQKDFLIQTNSFDENTRVAEKTIKTTTYKVIIDGKLVETKTITDSYVPYIPTINKSENKQSFKKVTTRKGVQTNLQPIEDTSLKITQRRPMVSLTFKSLKMSFLQVMGKHLSKLTNALKMRPPITSFHKQKVTVSLPHMRIRISMRIKL